MFDLFQPLPKKKAFELQWWPMDKNLGLQTHLLGLDLMIITLTDKKCIGVLKAPGDNQFSCYFETVEEAKDAFDEMGDIAIASAREVIMAGDLAPTLGFVFNMEGCMGEIRTLKGLPHHCFRKEFRSQREIEECFEEIRRLLMLQIENPYNVQKFINP